MWDGLPHVVDGQHCSGNERGQMLVNIINSCHDGYQAKGTAGKVVLQGGRYQMPWSKNLDYEYHQELLESILTKVSDPQWRVRDLEMQRQKRV
ncbi:hypothetical protein H1R20_g1469, partial [Candolleomyces eurysporus]